MNFQKVYLYLSKSKICFDIACVGRKRGACNYESCELVSGGSDGEVCELVTVSCSWGYCGFCAAQVRWRHTVSFSYLTPVFSELIFFTYPPRTGKETSLYFCQNGVNFLSEPCLAGKKHLMTARVSMLLNSRASLTWFRACFLPGRANDLSAPRYMIRVKVYWMWRFDDL